MPTLTITSRGQVTLKKDVLQHLHLGPGDHVDIELLPNGEVRLGAAPERRPIGGLAGMLANKATRTVSIDEMNQTIADGWAGRL
jgi:antitoxin component of MazEF toxin-antitoxin module